MVYLFTGTPGSGKSLHMSKIIYHALRNGKKFVITNFYIDWENYPELHRENYVYVGNDEMSPDKLIEVATEYWFKHTASSYRDAESRILLFIDEAQLLFNARSWQQNYQKKWTWFFSVHRHYGFQIYLSTQMDTNLDKQVRGIVEYNCVHRKISNIGLWGKLISFFAFGELFYSVLRWYPMKEKVDGSFFRYRKKYGGLYDTHALFSEDNESSSIISITKK